LQRTTQLLLFCCVLVVVCVVPVQPVALDVLLVPVICVAAEVAVAFNASTAPMVAITATVLTPPIRRRNSRRPSAFAAAGAALICDAGSVFGRM
jgi:hypothetical protein